MHTIIRIKKIITKKMNTKLGSTKIIFRQVCTNIYGTFNIILLYNFIKSAIQTKKRTDVMKEKLSPLIEEYRRINTKPKWFWSIE